MRNHTGWILCCLSLLVLILIAGCTSEVQTPERRTVLNVYVDDNHGDDTGAVRIAKIRMIDGKIELDQLSSYPENEILDEAIRDIETRPSLELVSEYMEDGRLYMQVTNITPDNPDFLYALSDALMGYSLKSVVGTETVPT